MFFRIIRLAIGIALVLIFGCTERRETFQTHYENRLRSAYLKDFSLEAESAKASAPRKKFLLGKQFLFVEQNSVSVTNPSLGDDYLKKKLNLIFYIYQDQDSPYPGFVSKTIGCQPEYLPKEFSFRYDKTTVRVVELFANERMIFGSCRPSEVAFRSLYAVVLCKDRSTAYELILFSEPKDKSVPAQSLADSIRCL